MSAATLVVVALVMVAVYIGLSRHDQVPRAFVRNDRHFQLRYRTIPGPNGSFESLQGTTFFFVFPWPASSWARATESRGPHETEPRRPPAEQTSGLGPTSSFPNASADGAAVTGVSRGDGRT